MSERLQAIREKLRARLAPSVGKHAPLSERFARRQERRRVSEELGLDPWDPAYSDPDAYIGLDSNAVKIIKESLELARNADSHAPGL